jgi:peptidyl-prolyl cis-trans isomerase-like 4
MSVVIETSLGDITVDLFTKERPKACFNFLKLCKLKYYNYCLFFDVKKNFIARTGDPTNSGTGGESIYWQDKSKHHRKKYFSAEQLPIIKHDKIGRVSMINNGQSKHGSQFFITLAADLDYLDKQGHTVFGQVVEGLDVLDRLNAILVDDNDHPLRDTCISHTVVLHDPYSDPSFVARLARQPSPDIPDYLVNSNRVGIYDDLDADEGKTAEEIEAELEAKEAQEKAILLEMLGDLPSADAKPPENVLFICRLNPVTEEEDLERIFSRFGKINSVKIVRDPKTNQSLQYGFIEYDNKDDCERAYLKMDNVLLDDRRIHVDFSQSVSKYHKKAV